MFNLIYQVLCIVFNIIIPSYTLKKGHIRLIKLGTFLPQNLRRGCECTPPSPPRICPCYQVARPGIKDRFSLKSLKWRNILILSKIKSSQLWQCLNSILHYTTTVKCSLCWTEHCTWVYCMEGLLYKIKLNLVSCMKRTPAWGGLPLKF